MYIVFIPHTSFLSSWVVNVLDGILLIAAHATDPGPGHTRSVLYRYIYDPVYIYIIWLLEVHIYLCMYACCNTSLYTKLSS